MSEYDQIHVDIQRNNAQVSETQPPAEVPFCNPCQSYHSTSQPCFDAATTSRAPSTTTTSAAVEAANAAAAATEICDWCGVDSNDAERVAAIISRHFPPTAIPAAETPQTFRTTKEAMLHAQRQGLPTVVPAEDRSITRANAIDEAIKLEPHVYMDYAATTINSESKKVAHDVCRTYAAALEALKQDDGRRSG